MTTSAGIWPTGVAHTEQRLAESAGLDEMTSLEVLTLLNRQDATVAGAVAAQLPAVARLVDAADAALDAGERSTTSAPARPGGSRCSTPRSCCRRSTSTPAP
ncbi:hypothetical protein [Cellulomonas sp. ATA003]|uniref:hypothetical protein n=1 Tax=Cellulomonas sp. ATA003 TaxID=3073064 RepID=UPI002873A59A|nr:hypothetical protein [Cellulomonas sp. ATA003]WNB86419.1 hypothetical protein REH70_04020 [Cellulomonas sp. ATA003]